MQRVARAWPFILVALALSPRLHAQPLPAVDLHGFRPPVGQSAGVRSESPRAEGPGQMHSSLTSSYALNAVQVPVASGETVAVVEHQILINALLARGFGSWLTLALDLPFSPFQKGELTPTAQGDSRVPSAALGDVEFRIKASLVGGPGRGGFQFALAATGTAPTGNPRSTLSDGAVTGGLLALSELDLLIARLRAGVGARLRSEPRRLLGERYVHALPWVVGIGFKPQVVGLDPAGRWLIQLEAFGSTTTGPSVLNTTTSPIALAVSSRVTLGEVSPILGVELPLNSALGNPSLRVILGLSWTPHSFDSDGDGIADEHDECPEIAEDYDGFEDTDGCPDYDNDNDGVKDADDQCPYEREDEDGFQDQDGCPDPDNDQDGLIDLLDACPDQAGPRVALNTEPGCPVGDRDGDGVPDDVDQCPTRKEDRDGFRDEDGCPDPDNDNDGIPDRRDRCPNEPGPNLPPKPGCPAAP